MIEKGILKGYFNPEKSFLPISILFENKYFTVEYLPYDFL